MSIAVQKHPAFAGLAIVASQVSINFGAAIAKGLFERIGPEGVATLRTGISAVLLLLIVKPWREALTRSQMVWLVLYGMTLGGMSLCIYWAIQRIPIGIAVAIEISGPLVVVMATSRSVRDFGWLALAIAGLLLLVPWPGASARINPVGIAFALGAALCWALYILFGKRASQVDGKVAVAIGMTVAALVAIPFGVAAAGMRLMSAPVLALGFIVASFSSALPYLLEIVALERLSSRIFGVVTSAAPAIAAMIGFLVLGEQLSLLQGTAIAMMIVASAGCAATSRPPVQEPREDAMV